MAVHDTLRDHITDLYEALDRWADGGAASVTDLAHHCIAFCDALQQHHTGEDSGLFRVLLKDRPDLEPVIEQLVRDHEFLATILVKIDKLAHGWADEDADSRTVHAARRELDGLAAVLENHFGYEERKLVAILDALHPAPGSVDHDLVNRALLLGEG